MKIRPIPLCLLLTLAIGAPALALMQRAFDGFQLDWNETFYPATMLLMHGTNPYKITTLHNPVWGLFPLVPLSLLGREIGHYASFLSGFFSFAFVALRLRSKLFALVLLLTSPLVLYSLFQGNLEWLVIWGFILPAPIGMFFLVVKPQLGFATMIYIAYVTWREKGPKQVILFFFPVTLALGATFLLFGNWLAGRTDNVIGSDLNRTLFPWSVPVGMVLLCLALRYRRIQLSIPASPLITPYLSLTSWALAQLGLVESNLWMFGMFISSWMIWIGDQVVMSF